MITRFASALAVCLVSLVLTGCPELGIPNPTASNSITIVNNYDASLDCEGPGTIDFFGVSRVICGESSPDPVNLLPAPIELGSEFTVENLPDGEYIIKWIGSCANVTNTERQVVEGGTNLRFFVPDA